MQDIKMAKDMIWRKSNKQTKYLTNQLKYNTKSTATIDQNNNYIKPILKIDRNSIQKKPDQEEVTAPDNGN